MAAIPQTPPITEQEMLEADERIPGLMAQTGRHAFRRSIERTGGAVIKDSDGNVVERRADGTSRFIKKLSVGVKVTPGMKVTFKRFR